MSVFYILCVEIINIPEGYLTEPESVVEEHLNDDSE